MKSLLGRLSLGLSLSLIALFIFQWWVVSNAMRHASEEFVVSHLEHDIDNLLGALREDVDGAMVINPARINGVFLMPFSGHYYQISVQEQHLYSRSLWDEEMPLPSRDDEAEYLPGPQAQTLLVLSKRFEKYGRPLKITVAEDMTPMQADLVEFQWRYGMLSLMALLVVILLQAWLVKRGLRPLSGVRHDIERLEQGEAVALREDVPSEIKPLVTEFNHLLQILRERLDRSRTALGNLAHAMKTPLTVLSRIEDDEALAGERHAEVRGLLQSQTEMIRQLVDRHLKRARLAGASAPGWQFVPAEELPPLVDVMKRIYADRSLGFELVIPDGFVSSAEREDMLELFGNLLENAAKWAKSEIRLEIEAAPGLNFTVEDDGPGCGAERREQLLERGVRGDESVGGHGLGLAIVQDIVDHYGGRIELGDSDVLGGFRVSIRLPAGRGS